MEWGIIGDTFSRLAKDLLPSLGSGIAQGAIGALFPGRGASTEVRGFDARTGTGQQAEKLRLGGAGNVGQQFDMAMRGELDPREKYNLVKNQRSASAAADALQTGGHAVRETNAIQDQLSRNRRDFGSLLGNLTSGYTPLNIQQIQHRPRPSLWGSILTSIAGRPTERAIENTVNSFAPKRGFEDIDSWRKRYSDFPEAT